MKRIKFLNCTIFSGPETAKFYDFSVGCMFLKNDVK